MTKSTVSRENASPFAFKLFLPQCPSQSLGNFTRLRDYPSCKVFFFLTAWQCITVLKSFIINRVLTKEIITVTVFGYLTVISRDFYDFFFTNFSLVLFPIEKKQTLFDLISKHLDARRIINSLLDVLLSSLIYYFVAAITVKGRCNLTLQFITCYVQHFTCFIAKNKAYIYIVLNTL